MIFELEKYIGIGFVIGYKNTNPKKENYIKSNEYFIIIIPFFSFSFNWSRIYKK